MKEINLAVIGCGGRGVGNFFGDLTENNNLGCIGVTLEAAANANVNLNVVAVCDISKERCEATAQKFENRGYKRPKIFTDYKELLKDETINTVFIFTNWETHIPISIAAMKAGKAVAVEVGGASNLQECYDLVETWEETKVPFMFLENANYGKNELLAEGLVRAGKFGDVVYCHGAYCHDLRKNIIENGYRLNNYINQNCDNYPTHDLGPICKTIDVNRGNKMNRLFSVATKAMGLKQYVKDQNEKGKLENKELLDVEFKQGDIVDTTIFCENGEVITLRLDTTLPRRYSREYTIRGTKGSYFQDNNSVFLDGDNHNEYISIADNNVLALNSADRFYQEYLPDCWKSISPEESKKGHGGTDYLMFKDLIIRLKEDKPMPIDVYDAAAWMCITPLSAESIKTGMPVEIPDFTKGEWKNRERVDIK